MYSAILESGQHVVHELAPTRCAWVHVVAGQAILSCFILSDGDSASVATERAVSLTARDHTEVLLFEVGEQTRGP
jgi:redox-sensitive bicupin YhaK (pirin superfamily)